MKLRCPFRRRPEVAARGRRGERGRCFFGARLSKGGARPRDGSFAGRGLNMQIEWQISNRQGSRSRAGQLTSKQCARPSGLTRYEIPIDSRLTDWLNDFGFPMKLSASALADPHYYDFVSEGIQALCAECAVFPCILDAAIFALKDGDERRDDNIIY